MPNAIHIGSSIEGCGRTGIGTFWPPTGDRLFERSKPASDFGNLSRTKDGWEKIGLQIDYRRAGG